MAKQVGLIKIRGTIGDLTFYETKHGHFVRKKRKEVPKQVFDTAPEYARQRENAGEFGHAIKAAGFFRKVLNGALVGCTDKSQWTRLGNIMQQVARSDPFSDRGHRNIMNGHAALLRGFEFNGNASLPKLFKEELSTLTDRLAGRLSVSIPAFVPADRIIAPAGATHIKFHSTSAEINFETKWYNTNTVESVAIPVDDREHTAAIYFRHGCTANTPNPLFLLLGIQFYQQVNGQLYPFMNNAFNAVRMVYADSANRRPYQKAAKNEALKPARIIITPRFKKELLQVQFLQEYKPGSFTRMATQLKKQLVKVQFLN